MKNDKTKHVIVGGILGLLTFPIAFLSGIWWAMLVTLVICTIISVGKEIYDIYKPLPTGFDKMDLLADYLGLFAGYIVALFAWGVINILKL